MSRSCHRATSCSPASRLERTTRARPLIVSAEIGLRLWGIADEPFWPGLNPSCTSADLGALEVAQLDGDELARRRRSRPARRAARRGGRGRSPGSPAPGAARGARRRTRSTAGSTFEYVPTAPDSLHTATDSRAAARRVRSRSSCSAHSATLAPNVVGSAWMPWVRPIITVRRWVRARSTSVVTAARRWTSSTRSAASRIAQHSAVSTTSDDVSP